MNITTSPSRLHEQLTVETFRGPLSDEDALLLMTLLHMYRIVLVGNVSGDRPPVSQLDGATQRRAARAVSALWQGRQDERSNYFHWYRKWDTEWSGYQHLENLSPHEIERLQKLKQRLARHPYVRRLEPEERDMKFRNAAPVALPEGQRLVAVVHWPAIRGGFGRELAPAAVLLATGQELVLLSEEKAWVRGPPQAKYGYVVTYFPLVRLASFDTRWHRRFSILELEMYASHGGESLQILFPSEQEQAVAQVVEQAMRAPTRGSQRNGL
jgi:hypothetical protein